MKKGDFLFNKIRRVLLEIFPYIVIVALTIILIRNCKETKANEEIARHNIEALTDTVHHYKSRYGITMAEKKILIGDIDLLKHTNDSLYKLVKATGVSKPQQVVYVNHDIIHEKHDTMFKARPDIDHIFDFSDRWRELSGIIRLRRDTMLTLSINRDVVHSGIGVMIKDGRAYAFSDNPYVIVTDIQGVTLPKEKSKHFHIGPYVGYGYNHKLERQFTFGVAGMYSLFSF